MTIRHIQAKIRTGDYLFSDHAVKRMIKRAINRHEIEEAILTRESVEEYPDDKYSPTCLICGNTHEGRFLHIQASFPPLVVIVTTYEPDPEQWIDGKIRR
ncbi:MAG: DUF4258 domain-containing protein [Deltaproteobacteria bacterium]|jgi:hypothetical protein|nr:DUF4258 domain-containing protein [Deltaproteobacteria bacterium]